jgi:hypothetical protein
MTLPARTGLVILTCPGRSGFVQNLSQAAPPTEVPAMYRTQPPRRFRLPKLPQDRRLYALVALSALAIVGFFAWSAATSRAQGADKKGVVVTREGGIQVVIPDQVVYAEGETVPPGVGKFDPSKMVEIDARLMPKDKLFPKSDVIVRYRPWNKEHHRGTLVVENLKIHGIVNQKAIDIGLTSFDRPTPVKEEPTTYSKVIVRNCDIYDVVRDTTGDKLGLHIDFLRICGGGDQQPIETEILVEDVIAHDGSALPFIIQDGKFSRITLRRIKMEKTVHGSVQIGVINSGSIKEVIIDDCPGLRVALMGKPGSIGKCIVKNSPGAFVRDTDTHAGLAGTKIINEDTGESTGGAGGNTLVKKPPVKPTDKPVIEAAAVKGGVEVKLDGVQADTIAFVIFEAFDDFDYRLGAPVIVTDPPYKATIKTPKTGKINCRATITRLGGDPEPALSKTIEVKK